MDSFSDDKIFDKWESKFSDQIGTLKMAHMTKSRKRNDMAFAAEYKT